MNSFGHLYRFTTWGESHGKAIGVTIDGCPPKVDLTEKKYKIFQIKENPDKVGSLLKEKNPTPWKSYQEFLRGKLQVLQFS